MKNWFVVRCCVTVWWVCVMVWFHLNASSKYGFPAAGVPSSPTHRFVASPLRRYSWLFFASHSSLCRCWRTTRAALCCLRYGSCMGWKSWIWTRKKKSRLLPWVVGAARVGAAGHIASARPVALVFWRLMRRLLFCRKLKWWSVRSGPGGFQASKWVGWWKCPSSQSSRGSANVLPLLDVGPVWVGCFALLCHLCLFLLFVFLAGCCSISFSASFLQLS